MAGKVIQKKQLQKKIIKPLLKDHSIFVKGSLLSERISAISEGAKMITIDTKELSKATIKGLVLLRDKKCTTCGSKKRLQVHHKNGKKSDHPDDLITFCAKCHTEEHWGKPKQEIRIKNLIRENNIKILSTIAPVMGITQSAISILLQSQPSTTFNRLIQLKNFVNEFLKTNYSLEEMFSYVDNVNTVSLPTITVIPAIDNDN